MPSHTNKLIHETSPYLLQHAHNPVNWYPWSEEALDKAIQEDKPILVSIGYSACHWCHVMERESFEDESTAALMNEHFVNIKIDREERPDLDHIYMDAVQALSGSGGWPLNIFLMPNRKPFYGGTYFPPSRAYNRPSWKEVLQLVTTAFKNKRQELETQSETLTAHLVESNSFGFQKVNEEEVFTAENTDLIYQEIMRAADKQWGGFGKAPKFPQTFSIQYLLRYHYEKSKEKDFAAVGINYAEQALFSLDKMIAGGIYDQLGGGFARYATDVEWLVPHFEKMLYDNALLLAVLSEAFQLTGNKKYEAVIHETMAFINREMTFDNKAFYAALDADSEGVEGKFYVWEEKDVNAILGPGAVLFNEYFDITVNGNWNDPHLKSGDEGINILQVKEPAENFAKRKNISLERLQEVIEEGKKKLLESRNKRIRPQLDDKIILGWNALMNTACCKAFAATGLTHYRDLAISNMHFLLEKFKNTKTPDLFHTWKNGQAKYPAFLDDYAFLIQALLQLQEVTGDTHWLLKAGEFTQFVIENFSEENGFFYYTKADQTDVIVQKKEVYDGAVPSGNAVMAANLYKLSILLDKKEWKDRSMAMITSLGKAITRYPSSFGNWAALLLEIYTGTNEIVLTGKDLSVIHTELLHAYIPHRVLMMASNTNKSFVLLTDKPMTNPPSIWLCRNFSCLPPLTTVRELITLINSRETQ